jgi:ATP-binding cassette subfamily F protein uup
MDHLVDQLFVFEGDGNIRLFNGNYSDYRDWLDDQQAAPEAKPAKAATPTEPVSSPAKKKLSYKEKQEFDALQQEINALEKRKAELDSHLNAGSNDHQQLIMWGEELQKTIDDLEAKTLRWLELSEMMA